MPGGKPKGPKVTRINPVRDQTDTPKDPRPEPGEEREVVLTIRKYDAIRRHGIAEVEGIRKGIRYYLRQVPDPIHARVVQVSRVFNYESFRSAPREETTPLLDEARAHLIGEKFVAIIFVNPSRRWSVKKILRRVGTAKRIVEPEEAD